VEVKTLSDGKAGWITTRGNSGTVFAAPSDRHWVLKKAAQLRSDFSRDSAVVGDLPAGRSFEAIETREDEPEASIIVKVRAVASAAEGWVSTPRDSKVLRPWTPKYECKRPASVTEEMDVGSKTTKQLVRGEVLEVIEGPVRDSDGGLLRVRCGSSLNRTEVGWATVRGADGAAILEVVSQ